MVLNLSKRQMNSYVVNLVLLAVVILSWVYVIIAGKFISERHLNNLLSEKEILEDVVKYEVDKAFKTFNEGKSKI